MRYHELAVQRWLYSKFVVREGYPVPVVFATPMDAFTVFTRLWKDDNNPFRFLLDLKDEHGTPLYEPHPSAVRYPLLSVARKPVKYRPYQNFSIHTWKHVNWPTISDTGALPVGGRDQTGTNLLKCDLGNVTTSYMPMALDYRFQIDHFCLRPDTQAFYLSRLMRQFWRTGATLQTWMEVNYPGWGPQYVRMYVDGDIVDHSAPEEAEAQDKNIEFRTSYTLVVEGFDLDLEYQTVPALWNIRSSSASPQELDGLFYPPLDLDLRASGTNPVLGSRTDIPSAGTCARDHLDLGQLDNQFIYLGDPNQPSVPPDNWAYQPLFGYGIPSTAAAGTPIVFASGTI